MMRLIRAEIIKLARRPRTYLGFAGSLLLVGIFTLVLRYVHPGELVRDLVGDDFEMVGTFLNGLFLARLLMQIPPVMMFWLPLFVCAVAGDLIAGEAAEGTLRTLLVRPVGRLQVLAAKFIVAVLHAGAIVLFLGTASLGIGALFFGVGDLFLLESPLGIVVIPMREALLLLAQAYAFSILAMVAVASLAFGLSSLVDNSIFAIGGTMMVIMVSGVLGLVPSFEEIHPYLITTHMRLWDHLFDTPVPWDQIRVSVAWLLGYIAVFLAGGVAIFSRKDILS